MSDTGAATHNVSFDEFDEIRSPRPFETDFAQLAG